MAMNPASTLKRGLIAILVGLQLASRILAQPAFSAEPVVERGAADTVHCCSSGAARLSEVRHESRGGERLFLLVEPDKRLLTATNAHTGTTRSLRLTGNERIVRSAQADLLLIVATNQRFLAYSAFATGWKIEDTVPNEQLLDMKVDRANAILFTTHRMLTFDSHHHGWTVDSRER